MHLNDEEQEIVDNILRFYLPEYEVRAFGSRVHGRNLREFSDLDLVVMSEKPLAARKWGQVKDAFTLSDLPFRVDVLDWSAVSENFRKVIEESYEVIHTPVSN